MPRYALQFEEHLAPIMKRGKVVLTEPLPEGAQLQVIRKTPIETDFLAEALKPFQSESFENTLDRICFIQQEIEGHLCDCRGEDYPLPGVPPVDEEDPGADPDNPACQPFSCDAYESLYPTGPIHRVHLIRAPLEGFAWWGATYHGEPEKWHGWANYIASPVLSDDWSGGIFTQEDVSAWSWVNDDTNIELCGGPVTVATNKNHTITSAMTFDSDVSFGVDGGSWGDYVASFIFAGHKGGPVGTQNVAWGLGKVHSHVRRQNPGTGAGTSVINPDVRVAFVQVAPGDYVLRVRLDYGSGGVHNPTYGAASENIDTPVGNLDERWNHITIHMTSDTPYNGVSSERSDRSATFVPYTVFVRINGTHYSFSGQWESSYWFEETSPITVRNARPIYEGAVFWRDAEITLASADIEVAESGTAETDTELMYTGFARNFPNYVPPPECSFVGDEI